MHTGLPVSSHHSPVIIQNFNLMRSEVQHRFDGQCQSYSKPNTGTAASKIRDLGIFMQIPADSMAHKIPDNTIPRRLRSGLNCRRDVMEPVAILERSNSIIERFMRHADQLQDFRLYISNRIGPGHIPVKALIQYPDIQAADITIPQRGVVRDTMDHFFID